MKFKYFLTFDDVLLLPRYSSVLPGNVDVSTRLSKNIFLKIPFVSAAMDTVTESKMAIELARLGGIGVVHKNMSIEKQIHEIRKVKRSESWIIVDPITAKRKTSLKELKSLMEEHKISGVPVVDNDGKLLGIVTGRDMIFESDESKTVEELMVPVESLVVFEIKGDPKEITLSRAKEILKKYKVEKLPLVDNRGKLKGLITAKDIIKKLSYPDETVDEMGRLRVAGAVGVDSTSFDRAIEMEKAGVDVIVIDTAHAHTNKVMEMTKKLKRKLKKADLIVGNVGTVEAVKDLAKIGPDAIKVGIGPGSICTTRIVAGIGVPQFTAIMECSKAAKKYKIPIIADGGIRYSGDVVKALAAGADSVMIGNLFAGTEESPGETILLEGRRYKSYRGMGSIEAMKKGSADRYFQDKERKFVPEGIEGIVPYRGYVKDVVYQLTGGLKLGMGYCGAKDIKNLRKNTIFVRISQNAIKESHPHDVHITKEAPNYEVFKK